MFESILVELNYLIGIAVSVVLGFAIGFERKLRFKEAGIRTHTIVCVGAALIMVVSKYAFGGQEADASRVAAQIVSGIGFLGAGIIMFRGQKCTDLRQRRGFGRRPALVWPQAQECILSQQVRRLRLLPYNAFVI